MSRTLKTIKWCLIVLVGVFIFDAFLSVLFPFSGGRYREKARRADCANHLRQLGVACTMYADLYQGRLPMDAPNPTLVGSMRLLSNFVSSGRIMFCPDDKRPQARFETDLSKLTLQNISYSYVPNQMWRAEGSNVIVMLDRIDTPKPGSKWPSTGNHGAYGGNVLFADGRVQWCTELPAALKDKDGREIVLSP